MHTIRTLLFSLMLVAPAAALAGDDDAPRSDLLLMNALEVYDELVEAIESDTDTPEARIEALEDLDLQVGLTPESPVPLT